MAEAQQALHGDPARRLPLGRALIPGIDPPTRLRAAAAALVPPLARRLVPPYMPAEERFHGERP
jgi:hypothetical protein